MSDATDPGAGDVVDPEADDATDLGAGDVVDPEADDATDPGAGDRRRIEGSHIGKGGGRGW